MDARLSNRCRVAWRPRCWAKRPTPACAEDAAIALARGARYGKGRAKPQIPPPALQGIRRDEAAAIVAGALQRGEGWLLPEEVQGLLSCYGLPLGGRGPPA